MISNKSHIVQNWTIGGHRGSLLVMCSSWKKTWMSKMSVPHGAFISSSEHRGKIRCVSVSLVECFFSPPTENWFWVVLSCWGSECQMNFNKKLKGKKTNQKQNPKPLQWPCWQHYMCLVMVSYLHAPHWRWPWILTFH